MEIKTMGELMISLEQYPHVNHRCTLREAIEVLMRTPLDHGGDRSLPRMLLVFDDIDQLVGLLRRRDILSGLEPEKLSHHAMDYKFKMYDVDPDPNLAGLFLDKGAAGLRERSSRPVTDVMVPPVVWVQHDDPLGKGMYEMVANDVSMLPVIRDKRVVGVVRSVDLLREVHRIITDTVTTDTDER